LTDGYHPPRISAIVLGLLLSAALLVAFLSLPQVVKTVGYGLLWIPAKIGIVEQVARDEVITLVMAEEPHQVPFESAGRYTFYIMDPDLLEASDALMAFNNPPWLNILAPDGSKLEVAFIERGLLPFDTPLAAGRPILNFIIPEPGVYTFKMPRKLVEAYITPDVVTGREGALWLVLVLELALAALIASVPLMRARRQRAARIAEVKGLKTVKGDAFWAQAKEKRTKPKH